LIFLFSFSFFHFLPPHNVVFVAVVEVDVLILDFYDFQPLLFSFFPSLLAAVVGVLTLDFCDFQLLLFVVIVVLILDSYDFPFLPLLFASFHFLILENVFYLLLLADVVVVAVAVVLGVVAAVVVFPWRLVRI
jgi:hypothetical protein